MIGRPLTTVAALMLLGVLGAHARRIGYIPTSDELMADSKLVCNGQVIDLVNCGPDEMHVYTGGQKNGYAETWMLARVKILHVLKGVAPTEIVMRYRVPQPNALLVDSPMHLKLEKGQRYCFFLKASPKSSEYLAVLDGLIDDGFGLKTLLPDQADSDPPLTDDEAKRIALGYLKTKRPGIACSVSSLSIFPSTMADSVYVDTSTPLITVVVLADRTVDEKASRTFLP